MANGLWKLLSSATAGRRRYFAGRRRYVALPYKRQRLKTLRATTAGTPSLLRLFKQDAGGAGGNDETMVPEDGAVRNAGDVMPTAVVEPFRMFQVADIERRDVAF